MYLCWRTGCARNTGRLFDAANHQMAAAQFEQEELDDGWLPPRSVSVVDDADDGQQVSEFLFVKRGMYE